MIIIYRHFQKVEDVVHNQLLLYDEHKKKFHRNIDLSKRFLPLKKKLGGRWLSVSLLTFRRKRIDEGTRQNNLLNKYFAAIEEGKPFLNRRIKQSIPKGAV